MWESVFSVWQGGRCVGSTDCHTGDVGHRFAMTGILAGGAARIGGGTHGCRPTEELTKCA